MAAKKLVILDNTVVLQLLRRPDVVAAFPFMKGMAAKATSTNCVPCSRKNRQNLLDLEGIKAAIANMDNVGKKRLCQILDTENIRVTYLNPRGQRVRLTVSQ